MLIGTGACLSLVIGAEDVAASNGKALPGDRKVLREAVPVCYVSFLYPDGIAGVFSLRGVLGEK